MGIDVGIGFMNGTGGKLFLEAQGTYSVIPIKVRWVKKFQNTCDVIGIYVLEPM